MPQEVTNTPVERVENPPPSTDTVESSPVINEIFQTRQETGSMSGTGDTKVNGSTTANENGELNFAKT